MCCVMTPRLAELSRLCPGLAPDGPPLRTATSILQPGRWHGRPVVLKLPTDPRPWWQDRCRHEITIYQAFAAHPPPVTAARLVAADPDVPLLVLTHLPGQPLNPDRYLRPGHLRLPDLHRYLTVLEALHRWSPDHNAVPDDSDYPAQLARLTDVIDSDDIEAASSLHAAANPPIEVSHGDAHLGNTLAHASTVALIDFEFTAWRPIGYDHAKLWIFCQEPAARAAVQSAIGTDPQAMAGFWIGVVLTAAREILSYRRQRHFRHCDERLAALATCLRRALAAIADLN